LHTTTILLLSSLITLTPIAIQIDNVAEIFSFC
jgi:hypothetical protein